jgi:predicted flavoprotein YhiN
LLKLFYAPTVTERGQRVFPASGRAEEVVQILYRNMLNNGVEIICKRRVQGVEIEASRIKGIKVEQTCPGSISKLLKPDPVLVILMHHFPDLFN